MLTFLKILITFWLYLLAFIKNFDIIRNRGKIIFLFLKARFRAEEFIREGNIIKLIINDNV